MSEHIRTFVDMPDRIAGLPRDSRGFPVPRFVYWTEAGEPDFRMIKPGWMTECIKHNRCWLCGGHMGRHMAFVIGPMCCVNRVNAEPPSHYDCARFAARNCPFLTKPKMRRNAKDMPPEHIPAPGLPIDRNPGVCAIWVTSSYKPYKAGRQVGEDGVLFDLGPATRLEFWCEGRPATRAEVDESVRTGLPLLQAVADAEGGTELLARRVTAFTRLFDDFPEAVQ